MTTAYRLHYAPDNASLIIRLALLELEVPFDCALLDRETRAHKSAEYLALNPAGRIPALETPDGVMFETGAILLWLADKHQALFPKADDPARSHALKWLFYVSNTLHANLNLRFYPDQYTSEAHEALRAGAVKNIKHAFSLLNDVKTMGVSGDLKKPLPNQCFCRQHDKHSMAGAPIFFKQLSKAYNCG